MEAIEKEKSEFDIFQVFVRVPPGHYAPYTGGSNFADGMRPCTNCKSNMTREPVEQPFVRVDGGKIMVDIQHTDGRLIVNRNEPDYHWSCTKCNHTIPMHVKKKAVMTTE